jgi:Xaa-Pro aminopeptidase
MVMIDRQVIKERVKKVSNILQKKNISFFLLTSQANVTYVTGFLGHESWAVFTPDRTYLLTDSRYIEEAEKECPLCKIILRKITLHDSFAEVIQNYKNVRTVAVEDCTSLMDFNLLKKKVKARLQTVSKIVEPVRSIKDAGELGDIKRAIQITAMALKDTLKALRVGMTENEATGLLDYNFRKNGGRNGFDTIMAFGPNGSRCHHQPGSRKLKANDTVLIDFGAEYNHYRCDVTRTFLVGRPNSYFEKVYRAVLDAQQSAIRLIRPGLSNKEPERTARQVIEKYGLPPYQHGTGHGFGLVIHEVPFLSIRSKERLAEGMVLTVEPGIYLPEQLGVRIEDNVLITKTGCKVLTGVFKKDYKSICLGDIR